MALGLVAGLLEELLDVDLAAGRLEHEVLADLADLGHLGLQFLAEDLVVVEVVLGVGLLVLGVVLPLHDAVHDLLDRQAARVHPGDVVEEQRLEDLLAAGGVDLEPPLGGLADRAAGRLVGFPLLVELRLDGGDAGRRARGVLLVAHHVVEHLPERDHLLRLRLALGLERLVHEVDRRPERGQVVAHGPDDFEGAGVEREVRLEPGLPFRLGPGEALAVVLEVGVDGRLVGDRADPVEDDVVEVLLVVQQRDVLEPVVGDDVLRAFELRLDRLLGRADRPDRAGRRPSPGGSRARPASSRPRPSGRPSGSSRRARPHRGTGARPRSPRPGAARPCSPGLARSRPASAGSSSGSPCRTARDDRRSPSARPASWRCGGRP